jgi:hypothetical protein
VGAHRRGRQEVAARRGYRRLHHSAGIEDRSTEQVFDDEFGSLSSDADWASREMFKAAMRERFPEHLPSGSSLSIITGPVPPASPSAYDEVVDLRKLRQEGDRLLSAAAGEATTASRR